MILNAIASQPIPIPQKENLLLASHTCCLDRPFALTELSTHSSLVLSSELSLLSRHLGLGCCHLASQELSCPSVDMQREELLPRENPPRTPNNEISVNCDDKMTLKCWYWFNGEHPATNRRQFSAHGCRGGMRQPRPRQTQDVLRAEHNGMTTSTCSSSCITLCNVCSLDYWSFRCRNFFLLILWGFRCIIQKVIFNIGSFLLFLHIVIWMT